MPLAEMLKGVPIAISAERQRVRWNVTKFFIKLIDSMIVEA